MSSNAGGPDRDVRELLPLVYEELRHVAERYLARQAPGFTLRPTELVHEACLHMIEHGQGAWTSTGHFRAIAAAKIWQVVVDHLKRRNAVKRGGPGTGVASTAAGTAAQAPARPVIRRVPIDPQAVAVEWRDYEPELLDLADALAELARESSRLRDVVVLHWFGGLTHAEVAAELGVSPSTAEKDFRYALAWLNRRLSVGSSHGD